MGLPVGVPVALVPGVLALLPEYASIEDPVAELRAAALSAVGGLGPRVLVVASEATGGSGRRVGEALVAAVGAAVVAGAGAGSCAPDPAMPGSQAHDPAQGATGVLVIGNGSATRTEKAPGHLDERAESFDDAVRAALASLDFTGVDASLAAELWADVEAMRVLPEVVSGPGEICYRDAPFGVAYCVARWAAGDGADRSLTERPADG
ncbi:hypothetical protein [Nocardioides sp. YIM 152588]|uniref:hypothetical protein n=1 Tax=Nocardioides sp. YIM 152588 TaxID=3158259 RepID=UPI0032E41D5A